MAPKPTSFEFALLALAICLSFIAVPTSSAKNKDKEMDKDKDKDKDKNLPTLVIDYEGFADYGRVSLRLDIESAHVRYAKHPMVTSKTNPWEKRVKLEKTVTEPVLALASSERIRTLKCEPMTLMPGQDVVLQSLRISQGPAQPFFSCDFVDPPSELAALIEALGQIYDKVKNVK